jgi:hypothetical protein
VNRDIEKLKNYNSLILVVLRENKCCGEAMIDKMASSGLNLDHIRLAISIRRGGCDALLLVFFLKGIPIIICE